MIKNTLSPSMSTMDRLRNTECNMYRSLSAIFRIPAWFCLLKIIVVTKILWKIWRSLTENILWLFCGLLGDFYGPSKIITSQYSVSDQQKFLWGSRIPEMSIWVRTWMQGKKNTPVASYPFPDSYCRQLLCIQTPPGRTGIGICRIQVPLVIPL